MSAPDAMGAPEAPCGVLDGVALFEHFTPEERAAVAARGRVIAVAGGAVLMHEGEDADRLYVLLEGTVRILRRDPAGHPVDLARREAGECFGEIALIDGGTRSATVVADTDCRLFELTRPVFLELLAPSPGLLAKLLRDLGGKIRDTSERLAREDLDGRMRAAEAELARHRAIVQAVTGLAHELNTPLGICVTTASHLQALVEPGPEPLRESAALLCANLERAVALVEAFTAIAAAPTADTLETVDLVDLCEHAAALMAMERPQAPLAVTVDAAGPRPWHGHRPHLERALVELLSNAAAHAYPAAAGGGKGGGAVAITVEDGLLDRRPAWRLTVRDRGCGIAAEAVPKLFDAFFTTARGRGHKGLGLTIVYNTVTGPLGGRVAVESAPGQGTAAVLLLPKRR